MKYVTQTDINNLLKLQDEHDLLISIYMPVHPGTSPANIDADRIRFKNSIQEAEAQLAGLSVKEQESQPMIELANTLYNNIEFWRSLDRGLAVFITPGQLIWYDISLEVDELVNVGPQFVLLPLIVLNSISKFNYVLNLNLKQPKLFLASINKFEEVPIKDMPADMYSALGISEFEQEQQFHPLGNTSAKSRAMFHGHDSVKDSKANQIDSYFRLISRALKASPKFSDGNNLIMIGTPKHVARFKSISHIPGIADSPVLEGSYNGNLHEIKLRLERYFEEQIDKSVKSFREIFSRTDSSEKHSLLEPNQLKSAAEEGKILSLGINIFNRTRDKVGSSMRAMPRLDLHGTIISDVEELAQSVFKHGGSIVGTFLNRGDKRFVHAIFRY